MRLAFRREAICFKLGDLTTPVEKMAELDVQTDSFPSPPRFELEQAADYSQYLLRSKSEILAVLRAIGNKNAMITVYFDQGKSFLLTALIALTPDNRGLIFDIGSDEEMNRRALRADKLIFTTVVDRVKVQFSLPGLTTAEYEGRPAFIGSIPHALLRLQRREHYRLATPIINPLILRTMVKRADGVAVGVQMPLLDISGGGLALTATSEQALLLEYGATLADCKLMLPEEPALITTLIVRSLFDVSTRGGAHYVHVGCHYVNLAPAAALMIQRYIIRVERGRKARETGLA